MKVLSNIRMTVTSEPRRRPGTLGGCPTRRGQLWRQRVVLLALALLEGFSLLKVARAETDPALQVTVNRLGSGLVLSWYGSNEVSYQVETSATPSNWVSTHPVLRGVGAVLSVTNGFAAPNRAFFRVKRSAPGDLAAANFAAATGILTITGTALDDTFVVSRDAAGVLRVNNGAVPITGGTATVANTVLIQMFGREGHDVLSLDEANGPLPHANLFGEAGNDTLTGGSGADVLDGGPGADELSGKAGADTLIGGDGDDVLIGGDGDDNAQMGFGNDRFIWNPGDDTDIVEGGDGSDAVEVNGGNGAEDFTATANGTRVRFDRINPAPFFLDIGTCEKLVLNANGGNDTFAATGNLAPLIQLTVDGGEGDDRILGSNGADVLLGGDGNDFIDGQQGNDTILLGAGNDVFQWDPGDGSDVVEGQGGSDTLVFNASNVAENIDLSANGARLRLVRNVGNISLDVAGIETVQLNLLGGADTVVVNDLTPTEVSALALNLAGVLGGVTGDTQPDTLTFYGTAGADLIAASATATNLGLFGLKAGVTLSGGDTNDAIVVNAQGGDDTVDFSAVAGPFRCTLDGGAGNDTLIGSALADVLLGGEGADTLRGGRGDDLALGGPGDDRFEWNPGDGNEVLEGQDGTDTLQFNGSNVSENLDVAANGARLRLFRDVGNVTLDAGGVEQVQISVLGGTDTVVVGDLQTTEVRNVFVDQAAADGGDDGSPDSVIISGTQTNDLVGVSGTPGLVTVSGLAATVSVANGEPANDSVTINALGGADLVNASSLPDGVTRLILNGGLGDDQITGSQGADLITGGDGNDRLFGNGGDDTFVWNPGDDNDTLEGQGGSDTLLFNGSNVAENIDLSANGARLRFFRNVANVLLDCAGVERVQFNALGGADTIVVNNLAGTDVTAVNIALGATLSSTAGDAQPDTITVMGTAANDSITIADSATGLSVAGLPATLTITSGEGTLDRLIINALAGDDVAGASALSAGLIALTLDGGFGADVLIGSAGNDILLGGDGDDVLLGGPGLDVLDGGLGNNIVIQD